MHSLSVYGVLSGRSSRQIIATGAEHRIRQSFRALERQLQIETGIWALLLSPRCAAIADTVAGPLPSISRLWMNFCRYSGSFCSRPCCAPPLTLYGFALLAPCTRDRAIAVDSGRAARWPRSCKNLILTPLARAFRRLRSLRADFGRTFVSALLFSANSKPSPLETGRRRAEVPLGLRVGRPVDAERSLMLPRGSCGGPARNFAPQ